MLSCTLCEKVFLDVQTDPPVFQVVPVAFDPVVGHHYAEPGSVLLAFFLQEIIHITDISLSLLFFRLNSHKSQPFLSGVMLQSLNLCVSLLDSLQYVCVPAQRRPEPNPGLQVWPRQGSAESKDHLLKPGGNTLPKGLQDAMGLLCYKGTLVPRFQLGVHQDPEVLSSADLLSSWLAPSLHCCLGVFFCRHRISQFSLVNFMKFLPAHFSSL